MFCPPAARTEAKASRTRSGETETGKAYTMLTRGCGDRDRSAARVTSIACRIDRARSAISTSLALGLAMVSIKAEVSPKSLLNWTGPAPWGSRLFSALSLRLISENCFFGSFTVSSNCTYTNASPGKLMERMPKSEAEGGLINAFCAITCSTGRLTSCSTSCAVAPGHAIEATATRTGILGSLRLGMCMKPYQPHTQTASSSTSET